METKSKKGKGENQPSAVEFATDYRTYFFRGLTIIDVTAHKDVPVVPILIGVLDPFHQVPTPGIGDEVEMLLAGRAAAALVVVDHFLKGEEMLSVINGSSETGKNPPHVTVGLSGSDVVVTENRLDEGMKREAEPSLELAQRDESFIRIGALVVEFPRPAHLDARRDLIGLSERLQEAVVLLRRSHWKGKA